MGLAAFVAQRSYAEVAVQVVLAGLIQATEEAMEEVPRISEAAGPEGIRVQGGWEAVKEMARQVLVAQEAAVPGWQSLDVVILRFGAVAAVGLVF